MRKGDGMPDALSEHYADLLEGSYDCVDRLVLNAYFRMGHSGGGFRTWWQKLYGSDKHLDNAHLMRMAGRFGRRLRAFQSPKHSGGRLQTRREETRDRRSVFVPPYREAGVVPDSDLQGS